MGNGDDYDYADSGEVGTGLGMVTAMDEEKEYYWNVGTIARTRTRTQGHFGNETCGKSVFPSLPCSNRTS